MMKTKLLLALSVSLFCFGSLAKQGKSGTFLRSGFRPGQANIPAYQKVPVIQTTKCGATCAAVVGKLLPKEAIQNVNRTTYGNAEAKDIFLLGVRLIQGELVSLHREGSSTSFKGQEVAIQKTETSLEAISSALRKSQDWPQEAQRNVQEFIKGLTDGINSKEAKKLERVREDC